MPRNSFLHDRRDCPFLQKADAQQFFHFPLWLPANKNIYLHSNTPIWVFRHRLGCLICEIRQPCADRLLFIKSPANWEAVHHRRFALHRRCRSHVPGFRAQPSASATSLQGLPRHCMPDAYPPGRGQCHWEHRWQSHAHRSGKHEARKECYALPEPVPYAESVPQAQESRWLHEP